MVSKSRLWNRCTDPLRVQGNRRPFIREKQTRKLRQYLDTSVVSFLFAVDAPEIQYPLTLTNPMEVLDEDN